MHLNEVQIKYVFTAQQLHIKRVFLGNFMYTMGDNANAGYIVT